MKVFNSAALREYASKDQGELPPLFADLFRAVPSEVVQPETAREIMDVVRVAYKNGTPLVARGAASTAFGQSIPVKGGIVLDLNFYKGVRRVERGRGTVTVESGVRWSDLDSYLEGRGLGVCSYPSSWYSTVGGWIATGGLGVGSLKFGPLKEQVSELWVCFKDGEDRRLKPGDPLFDAYFESEGQMGVVLEATLRVRPRPQRQVPCLLEFDGYGAAWAALNAALSKGLNLFHASVYNRERMRHFDHALEAKMARKGSAVPQGLRFADSCGLLLVSEDANDAQRVRAWAREAGFKAAPDFKSSFLWSERFYPMKGKAPDRMFLGNEVLVANDKAADYAADLEALAKSRGLELALEGEAAGKARSLMLATFYVPAADPAAFAAGLSAVFQMDALGVKKHGGSLYHVGIYNTPFLERKFGPERLAALRAAKAQLDPRGLFNPGKFFEFTTRKTAGLPAWANRLGARLAVGLLGTPGLGAALSRAAAALFASPSWKAEDKVLSTARECVNCGFCLPVCPAYLATRDERTTARGKLHLFWRWRAGAELADEDAAMLHSCMHCGGCTAVCQSALDLVPVWDELESRVALEKGKPNRAIVDFVKQVEESEDYKRLLRKGTIAEYKPAAGGPPAPKAAAAKTP